MSQRYVSVLTQLILSEMNRIFQNPVQDPYLPLVTSNPSAAELDQLSKTLFRHGMPLMQTISHEDTPLSLATRWSEVGPLKNEPIAVIGMACRFPGSPGIEAFWENLVAGRHLVGQQPPERIASTPSPADEQLPPRGGFLDDVTGFDPGFFQISPTEAKQIDPQQRLVLELAWEALLDACIDPNSTRGCSGAIFLGAMWSDYQRLCAAHGSEGAYLATGGDLGMIAARTAYFLDWQGTVLSLNTASSSSLVALHQACRELARGDSEIALAGGVNLILDPHTTDMMTNLGTQSKRGTCAAFSEQGDGYVRGEGAGLVVLKPLRAALRDGDPIRALVAGSAVSNDGASQSLMTPSVEAQTKAIQQALAEASLQPSEVDHVECHGTGTPVGDPIEAEALGQVYGSKREQPLMIGSVKSNIGHLEAAAGVAGFIKTVLMLEHRWIPESLHCEQPNGNIDFQGLGLAVANEPQFWPTPGLGHAAVSSFGFGGTNCHMILSEWPLGEVARSKQKRNHYLLPLSAHSGAAMQQWSASLAERISNHTDLDRLCRMAAIGRDRQDLRGYATGSNSMELKASLQAIARHPLAAVRGPRPKLAFVFPGQGGQ